MNLLRGLLLFVLGLGVVGAGIVAYQLWINPAATPATASNSDARNQFLADRGGPATPISGTTGLNGQPGGGNGFPGGGFPGVSGTVQSVENDTLTVQSFTDSSTTTVHLAATTKISKQVSGQVSDIKVGDQLVAIGTMTGTQVTATRIQLGTTDGFGGGFGGAGFGAGRGPNASGTPGAGRQRFNGTPGAVPQGTPGAGRQRFNGTPGAVPQRTPGTGGGTGGQGFRPVTGTVKSIAGSTLTVEETGGTTVTVTLGANTQIERQQEIALTEVKTGDTVRATGTQTGAIFEATALQVGVVPVGGTPQP